MSDLICRKTMRACATPGMCSPFGGCSAAPPAPPSATYIVETSADTHAWHTASTHASAESADRAALDLMPRLPGIQFVSIRCENAPPAPSAERCHTCGAAEGEQHQVFCSVSTGPFIAAQQGVNRRAAPSAEPSKPVAEVVIQFGQRAIVPLAGAPDLPLGTKLYAHPAPALPAAAVEAMRMALEALEESFDDVTKGLDEYLKGEGYPSYDRRIKQYREQLERHSDAIDVLRAQIAQIGGGR